VGKTLPISLSSLFGALLPSLPAGNSLAVNASPPYGARSFLQLLVFFYHLISSKFSAFFKFCQVILKLNRPFHATWLVVPSVLTSGLLASNGKIVNLIPFFYFCSFAWITSNIGNFINDYYDVESDKVGRPKAPLAAGFISKKLARNILIIEYVFSAILLFSVTFIIRSIPLFVLGTIPLVCTYMYSVPPFKTKNRGAMGPITISISYASIVMGGWIIESELTMEAIKIGIFFGLLMLGVGFSKDFMHIEADMGFSNTPPIIYGFKKTATLAIIPLTLPLIFSPYFLHLPNNSFILFVIPFIFALVATFFMLTKPTAKNRNIVMSVFLVYVNATCIIISDTLANTTVAFFIMIIISNIIIIKTWGGTMKSKLVPHLLNAPSTKRSI